MADDPIDANSNLYRCTPRETRSHIVDCLEAGLVPNIIGSPGIGKSAIMHSVANEFGLKLIDHRVSTSAPEDFTGLPEFSTNAEGVRTAQFTPFTEILPIEGMSVPQGYEGWLLFLDEFNSGTKMVQAATYKTILDHLTGQKKLHPRLLKACAGNLITDRAIVEQLSTAMQSRLITIEMVTNFEEWLLDVALPEGYDERIISYLSYKNGELMDFRPDHDEKTFNCPRTWSFMNRLVKGKTFGKDEHGKFAMHQKTALYAGTITSGSAINFVAHCELQGELVTIKDVLADPENAELPEGAQRKYIVVSHLMSQVDEKNFGDVCTYINRLDLSFQVLFFRAMMATKPKLRSHPEFAKAMSTVSKHLTPKKK